MTSLRMRLKNFKASCLVLALGIGALAAPKIRWGSLGPNQEAPYGSAGALLPCGFRLLFTNYRSFEPGSHCKQLENEDESSKIK